MNNQPNQQQTTTDTAQVHKPKWQLPLPIARTVVCVRLLAVLIPLEFQRQVNKKR